MHSRRLRVTIGLVAVAALSVGGSNAGAQSGRKNFRTELEGAQETPAISTEATGEFRARLDDSGTQLEYELQYSGLEGGNTLFAHVHIGQAGVAGGVMFFLCGGGGKPACPNNEATITESRRDNSTRRSAPCAVGSRTPMSIPCRSRRVRSADSSNSQP